jgi:uncharacterized membrane protein
MREQLLIGVACAFLFSAASYVARFLTFGGSVAQFLLGVILLGFGGWQWTLPMMTFFILSSLISKFGKNEAAWVGTESGPRVSKFAATERESRATSWEFFFEKSSRRDAMQVIANGGVAGLITVAWLATNNDALYIAYLGAVAAATADTWGTELGTLSRSPPLLITSFKKVEAGRSGAVSSLGLLAGVAGCIAIVVCAVPWIRDGHFIAASVAVVGGGVIGSLADSILGATLQAQFRCVVCKRETERLSHCAHETEFATGLRFLRNDGVNLLCSVIGGVTSYILFI